MKKSNSNKLFQPKVCRTRPAKEVQNATGKDALYLMMAGIRCGTLPSMDGYDRYLYILPKTGVMFCYHSRIEPGPMPVYVTAVDKMQVTPYSEIALPELAKDYTPDGIDKRGYPGDGCCITMDLADSYTDLSGQRFTPYMSKTPEYFTIAN